VGGRGLNSCGSGRGPMAGSCEHGNEPLSSMKGSEFFDLQSVLSASQEALCSTELVSQSDFCTICSLFKLFIEAES
jgi:hypothetical protein